MFAKRTIGTLPPIMEFYDARNKETLLASKGFKTAGRGKNGGIYRR